MTQDTNTGHTTHGENLMEVLTDKQMEIFLLFIQEYYGHKDSTSGK